MSDIRILGESDWEDEDLLTHDEAGERLREEVQAELAFLESPAAEQQPLAAARSRARVEAMRERLASSDRALADGFGVVRRIGGDAASG
ncbi:hypothetical protein [Geodermatophilus sp. URMC 64]